MDAIVFMIVLAIGVVIGWTTKGYRVQQSPPHVHEWSRWALEPHPIHAGMYPFDHNVRRCATCGLAEVKSTKE